MGAWILLGTDSLIACIAVGPIMSRKWSVLVPFALLFGVGDGGGFLLGSAFHWSVSDNLSNILQTAILVALGIYWISLAIYSKWAAKQETQGTSTAAWAVWILPWALSIDNITFGLIDGVPAHDTVLQSACLQALSSAVQAGIGLAIGIGLVYAIPALRRKGWIASAAAGGAMIAAAGVLLVVG
jgi:putative Mn2+ efflux pump MntP